MEPKVKAWHLLLAWPLLVAGTAALLLFFAFWASVVLGDSTIAAQILLKIDPTLTDHPVIKAVLRG